MLANSAGAPTDTIANATFVGLHPELARALASAAPREAAAITAQVRYWLAHFERGDRDRSKLTARMSAAMTPDLVAASKQQFATLGEPTALAYVSEQTAPGGLSVYEYRATFPTGSLSVTMTLTADGKLAGFWLKPL